MSNLKVKSYGKVLFKLNKLCKCVYEELGQKEKIIAELNFVDGNEIQRLNREFRQVDRVTDILSFPSLDGIRYKTPMLDEYPDEELNGRLFIGNLVVCMDKVKEQAVEYGHSEEREIYYLICHGLLHLFGYDHIEQNDEKEMTALAEKIMNKFGVAR